MTSGALLLAAALLPGPALALPGSSAEETIWTLESAYFTSLYRAEYEKVLALVHPRFLAWPDGQARPLDRDGSAAFMRKLVTAPTPCRVEIERAGIEVSAEGTVALTQYVLTARCPGPEGRETVRSSRICHTWVRDGAGWKLLGGMSRDL